MQEFSRKQLAAENLIYLECSGTRMLRHDIEPTVVILSHKMTST